MLAGLIRMFAPVYAQKEGENNTVVYGFLVVLFAIGVFLTFKAYCREDNKAEASAQAG
jgi:hypothetical protein